MYTPQSLLDIHQRAHRSLAGLLVHCGELDESQFNRPLDGFGVETVRFQFHHILAAERYWTGVIQGRIDVQDDEAEFPTVASLEAFRTEVCETMESWLRETTAEELSTLRTMMTWGDIERELIPAHIVMRTVTHLYHHQGQILAMCRILGKPGPRGLDFPLD